MISVNNSSIGNSRRVTFPADGEFIHSMRLKLGLTQEVLGNAAGLSDRSVRSMESGKRVDARTLQALADCLTVNGIPMNWRGLVQSTTAETTCLDQEVAIGIAKQWFGRLTILDDPTAMKKLVCENAAAQINGRRLSGVDELCKFFAELGDDHPPQNFRLERILIDSPWLILPWGSSVLAQSSRTKQTNKGKGRTSKSAELSGVTLLKINGTRIAEIQEHFHLSH